MSGKTHMVEKHEDLFNMEIDRRFWKDICKGRGKMYLLDRDYSECMDSLPQVVNQVYDNFTSMANVIHEAALSLDTVFYYGIVIREMRQLIGFVRWALKWCVNEWGVTNKSIVAILIDVEAYFIETLKMIHIAVAQHPGSDMFNRYLVISPNFDDLVSSIVKVELFFKESLEPSIFLFSEGSVMERLEQAVVGKNLYYKRHRDECVFLEKFVQFLKMNTDRASWRYIYAGVECALDMMSIHVCHIEFPHIRSYRDVTDRIDNFIDYIILHFLVHNFGSTLSFTDELLVGYVKCLEKYLTSFPNMTNYQANILLDVLSLVRTFVSDTYKHQIGWEILSLTKMQIDNALRKLGCIFSSDFDGDFEIFNIPDWLTEIFRAFFMLPLDAFGFLSDETLLKYAFYFQHFRFELPNNIDGPSGDQFEFGKDLVFVACVVFDKCLQRHVENDVLFNGRVEMVGVLRDCVSTMSSYLCNNVKNNLAIRMTAKLAHMKKLFSRTITTNILKILKSVENPKTDLLGFLDFFLENLKKLSICSFDLVRDWKDQLQTIQDDMAAFGSFLQNVRNNNIRDARVHDLSIRIRNAAYNVEYVIDSFAAGALHISCRSLVISDLIKELNLLKETETFKEVLIKNSSYVLPQELVPATSISSRASVPPIDIFVGLEAERKRLMKFLGSDEKQLGVISIVGMGGIGKTTLAKKVYEEHFTVKRFDLRVWCRVSQEYDMKDVLLSILGSDVSYREKSCQDLSLMLHKKLIGYRYLIVLDDIWYIDVFYKLKRYFPDYANGSRIVLTSRTISTGLDAKHQSETIELPLLSNDESWIILKQKVFHKEDCPIDLFEIANEIARKCGGLPLAVVVMAGILSKSNKEQDSWEEIAKRWNIYTAEDGQGEGGMKALDLSYELLPDHLKPLFLYVGAFPEDYAIPTNNLKWIWIAEGFIRQETEKNKSLEDQAETHLMDLIDRSLLMVVERNSSGLVKTCHIHDLMRQMSMRKAEDENFMQHHHIGKVELLQEQQLIYPRRVSVSLIDIKDASTPTSSIACEIPSYTPITYEDLCRLSLSSRLNSFMLFEHSGAPKFEELCKPMFQIHKMLRVFYTDNVKRYNFFKGESLPVHLRCIFVHYWHEIPLQLFSTWNLETLIINLSNESIVELPVEFWKMVKLRHLHIPKAIFSEPDEDSCKLENLRTLSTPHFIGEETKMIGRFPNLWYLKCVISGSETKLSEWSRLESLHKLESVRVQWEGDAQCLAQLSLPSSLKKLSLSSFCLKWKDISIFQELPNLEVLILGWRAVEDELWDMGGVRFRKLKSLKLKYLCIKRWMTSDKNFPVLQNLILDNCTLLEEIPPEVGDICSLEKIEVKGCSHSASVSAKQIQQDQEDYGNGELRVYVSHPCPEKEGD